MMQRKCQNLKSQISNFLLTLRNSLVVRNGSVHEIQIPNRISKFCRPLIIIQSRTKLSYDTKLDKLEGIDKFCYFRELIIAGFGLV